MRRIFFQDRNWLAIVGITCTALALRLYKLGQWDFHVDEVAAVYHTVAFPRSLTIHPIIYLLFWLWKEGFGISELSMRIIPCVIGVITIPILYFPMKKIFGPLSALVACALISLSPWHLFWSQTARHYTLVLLLGAGSTFCFYFALEKDSVKLFIGSLVLAILSILSHTPSFLILPSMALYMIILWILPVEKPKGLKRHNLVIVILVTALPALTFLVPGFFGRMISAWSVRTWGGGAIYVLMSLIYRLGVPTCLLALFSLIHLLQLRDKRGVFLMSFLLFPLGTILCGATFANISAYYLFYTVPLYFLLAGYGAITIFNTHRIRTLGMTVTLILLVTFIGEDFLYFNYQNGGRAKWRNAFQTISQASLSNYTVVTPGAATIVAEYYIRRHDNIISYNYLKTADNGVRQQLGHKQDNWLIPGQIFILPDCPNANMLGTSYPKPEYVWFVIYRQSFLRNDAERKLYKWILAHCRLVAEYPVFYIGPKDETINVFLYPPGEWSKLSTSHFMGEVHTLPPCGYLLRYGRGRGYPSMSVDTEVDYLYYLGMGMGPAW